MARGGRGKLIIGGCGNDKCKGARVKTIKVMMLVMPKMMTLRMTTVMTVVVTRMMMLVNTS